MMEWEEGGQEAVAVSSVSTTTTRSVPFTTSHSAFAIVTSSGNGGRSYSKVGQDDKEFKESLDLPTDLSAPKKRQQRKQKPIPPPLDLSIGSHNGINQIPNTHQNQYQHQATPSPKCGLNDKNLPLRKRWHSWSPVPMNGQDDSSIVPLYPDSNHNMHNKTGLAGGEPQYHQQPYPYVPPISARWTLDFSPPSSTGGSTNSSTTSSSSSRNHQNILININGGGGQNHQQNGNSDSLQTPTPFYTPNEPSPKFMNSPVFSYSTDASLYQGPFSPMRASSLYPPPSSPFTNLSLNSPLLSSTGQIQQNQNHNHNQHQNQMFNMIPSTLLSPAPSQASTNSLSYEDLQEKSLSFFTPIWSIFLAGTKVRFVTGMNSMDWYMVDFLNQSGESLMNFKGEYAPHGLEVRKFIVTSSAKERIQVTFCPVADPHHPMIEVNCEPGHPFMVDKKGWCAVKPEVFQEIYGTQCQPLECGDICLNITQSRSPSQYQHHQHQHPQQNHHQQQSHTQQNHQAQVFSLHGQHHSGGGGGNIKMEPIDEKMIVPISVVPSSTTCSVISRKHSNLLPPLSPLSITPAKKSKEGKKQDKAQNEAKGRRPMNGFLLFAKDKRPELIQMYPGKDNRSISVLLGEAWQSLAPTEREKYSLNAKARAEEQKRIHPDCWKRKRSKSTSSN